MLRLLMALLAISPIGAHAETGILDSVKQFFVSKRKMPPPAISVLIVQDQPGVMLEVRGKYHIYDPNSKEHISTRVIGKRKFLQALPGGLKWGEEFPGIYQLQILPEEPETAIVVNGNEYRGSLYVYDVGGNISLVNKVDLEDFLNSTLRNQFEEPLPEETLAAVAIASRTNAYYRALHPLNSFWAVDADRVGYEGVKEGSEPTEIENAIRATRHMVLSKTGTYEGKITPFPAQWGSTTGGQKGKEQGVFSRITLFDAEEMANHGDDAAVILQKAFPNSHIELIY